MIPRHSTSRILLNWVAIIAIDWAIAKHSRQFFDHQNPNFLLRTILLRPFSLLASNARTMLLLSVVNTYGKAFRPLVNLALAPHRGYFAFALQTTTPGSDFFRPITAHCVHIHRLILAARQSVQ
jgi:hypothetical protein